MPGFIELKRAAEEQFSRGSELADRLKYPTNAETMRNIQETFRKKELMVVVIGEARRGKSSLLNALLDQKTPLFPVDVNVCTNVVTIVRYGEEEKIEALLERPDRDGTLGYRSELITHAQIPEYISEQGNPNNYKNVKVLNISLPSDLLKDGSVFVDTPGVGSLNLSHAETTYGFLPNADLLLFVGDTVSGLTETELEFLKKGYEHCKNIVFPLTKKDLNADYQVIAEDNAKKIARATGMPVEDIHLAPVSSTAKLRYLQRGNESMYQNSGYPQLEALIWDTIARTRAQVLILPFLFEARQELLKMANSTATQFQLLEKQDKQKELMEELSAETERTKELRRQNANWRNELSYFCTSLSNVVGPILKQAELNAQSALGDAITRLNAKICEESHYQQIYEQINVILSSAILEIRDTISCKVEDEVDLINRDLGLDLDLNRGALEKIYFTPDSSLAVTFPPRKKSDAIMAGGQKIGMGVMAGGRIGMIVGGVLGVGLAVLAGPALLAASLGSTATVAVLSAAAGAAGIGSAAGGALGGAKGCLNAVRNRRDVDIPVVRSAFSKHISSSVSILSSMVSDTIAQLRMQLTIGFDERISSREEEIREHIDRLRANLQLSKVEIPKKLQSLRQQDELIRKSIRQSEELERQIVALAAEPAPEIAQRHAEANVSIPEPADENPPEKAENPAAGKTAYAFL